MYATKDTIVKKLKPLNFAFQTPIPIGFKAPASILGKCLLFTFLSLGAFFSYADAQTVTVYPSEHPEAVTNPGMGIRYGDYSGNANALDRHNYFEKAAKLYMMWGTFESSTTEDITQVVNETNKLWSYATTRNFKVTPRIWLHWMNDVNTLPMHLQPWDYNSEASRDHVLRIIRKIGKAWDKDPRVQSVEAGIIGNFGEQQSFTKNGVAGAIRDARVGPDKVRWQKIMADAYKEAFPNKTVMVREIDRFVRYGNDLQFGGYWDLFACPNQYGGSYQILQNFGDRPNFFANNNTAPKHYLTAPVMGEVDWHLYDPDPTKPNDRNDEEPLQVGTWDQSIWSELDPNSEKYSTRWANYVRKVHASAINGISWGSPKNTRSQKVFKALGYRFHITEFSSSVNNVKYGTPFTISAKIKNLGSAPIYQNHPVYFFLLRNQTDSDPVYKVQINDIDIRKWHPGSDFDWDPIDNATGTQVYKIPPAENLISASITIPSTVPVGEYYAGIAIIEPSTGKPAIFFAIPNFFKESQTQPLCKIGVEKVPASFTISGVTYDSMDPVNDKRSYSLAYYKTIPEVKVEVLVKGVVKTPNAETAETPKESVQVRFTRQASDSSSALNTTKPLKVTFDVGGTATSGADYTLPASAVIPVGATSVTVDLNVLDDKIMEPNETVELTVTSNQLDYYLTNPKKVTVTIKDDTDFEVRKSVGAVKLLGSWVQGKTITRQTGTNRALVVLVTGRHEYGVLTTNPNLKVKSVTYGGQAMKLVKESAFKQGVHPLYTYSGVFVLEEAKIVTGVGDDKIVVVWQTPDGALEPKDGSNIMSAFFSNVSQTVLQNNYLSIMNPLTYGQKSNDYVYQISFGAGEFKNEEGDAIIIVGGIQMKDDGEYRIDSGFTSFGEKLSDGTYRVGPSGSYYGFKMGTGVAERPTFHINYWSRKCMVGFVLKKQGYTFSEWNQAYGLTGANAESMFDFDKDGMPNLMEYAVGMNPNMPETNPIVQDTYKNPITGKNYLRISVNLDPNAAKNVTVRGETTGDLKGVWSSDLTTAVQVLSPSPNFVVRDRVAIEDAPKRFLRLVFTSK